VKRILAIITMLPCLALGQSGAAWDADVWAPSIRQREQVTRGLVAYWAMRTDGGTTVYDETGSLNASATGGVVFAHANGVVGVGADFDGSDDRIIIGDANIIDTATALTVSAWVKCAASTSDDTVFSKFSSAGSINDGIALFRDNVGASSGRSNTWNFGVHDSTGSGSVSIEGATGAAVIGVWVHVCGTVSIGATTDLRLYINGIEDANSPGSSVAIACINTGSIAATIGDTFISADTTRRFVGQLDEVRIYNRALTAAEITQLYRMGKAILNLKGQ